MLMSRYQVVAGQFGRRGSQRRSSITYITGLYLFFARVGLHLFYLVLEQAAETFSSANTTTCRGFSEQTDSANLYCF